MDSDTIIVQMYDFSPGRILDCGSKGMNISENKELAQSFYDSRHKNDPDYDCNYDHSRDFDYERNAGAAELYVKECDKYVLYVHQRMKKKQYHTISFGNKYLKESSKIEVAKRSTYTHSERMLMKDILDDLLTSADASGDLIRPSDCPSTREGPKTRLYEILKYFTENASKYRDYLIKKGFIVKMWSERSPCDDKEEVGGACDDFIRNILPGGSHCGFIIKNYSSTDPERMGKARQAFAHFEAAFKKAQSSDKVVP